MNLGRLAARRHRVMTTVSGRGCGTAPYAMALARRFGDRPVVRPSALRARASGCGLIVSEVRGCSTRGA
jgi:hypothetical protein